MGSWNLSPERGKCDGAQGPTGCLYAIRTDVIKQHDNMQIVKLSSNGSHLHPPCRTSKLWSAWDGMGTCHHVETLWLPAASGLLWL